MTARQHGQEVGWDEEDWRLQVAAARGGSVAALGRILESCRIYLTALAKRSLNHHLQSKVDPADLVQETFLEAHQGFGTFAGKTQLEVRVWIGRILVNNVINVRRKYCACQKRSVLREQGLDSFLLDQIGPGTPPDQREAEDAVDECEQRDHLAACLELLPYHHRQVLLLRFQLEHSFAEIGHMMDRSEDAVQKLWTRAVLSLRRKMIETGACPVVGSQSPAGSNVTHARSLGDRE